MPAPHHSVFYGPDALSVAQPTMSEHAYLSTFFLLSEIVVLLTVPPKPKVTIEVIPCQSNTTIGILL